MTASRRLLLLNYEYPPLGGGAANATLFMARALTELGHHVVVVTSALGNEQSCLTEHGVMVHRLRTRRAAPDRSTMGDMCRYITAAVRHAPRIAQENHLDAAIAFFTIPSGIVARWLSFRRGLPYVVSLRGSDVPGHDRTLDRMHRITRPLRRSVLRRSVAIVANSEGLAATARAADPFPVRIIANGVDQVLFTAAADADHRVVPPLRLLFVGRVHREKNLRVVIEQLPSLPEIELKVAGDGEQRESLTALAAGLGVSNRVRWLGWQTKAALPQLYREADAVVNPSLYEGLSNVVLEAMATGLPVVASDVPGNRAAVVHGTTGMLFPLDRPDELRGALARLVADETWRRELGLAARARVERDFSWARAAKSYLELLGPAGPTSCPS